MNHFDVVADSEGEELEFRPSKATKALSSIETAGTGGSGMQRVSSIVPATSWTTTPARAHGHQECDASTSARMLDMDFPDAFSIADRAKTRQRNTKRPSLSTPGPSSPPVPHPFDADALFESYHVPDMLGEDDSEDYSTSHSKPKPRPKPKQKPAEVWDNGAKIGYNSNLAVPAAVPSGSGQSSVPPGQSRPKPRPVKRSPKTNVDPPSEVEQTINNYQEQQPTSQLSLPVPTSPLPPSDPPLPTPTILSYHSGSMPPIVTLADPPSSPSSLFSTGDKYAGLGGDAHIPGVDDDPLFMGPPSTFFTGSSSPDQPAQQQKSHSKPKLNEAVDIIDLCTAPPQSTDVQVLAVKKASSSKKGKEKEHKESRGTDKSKTKAKGKRKARDEDEFGPHADDDDDDYEESGKSKKAKAAVAKRGRGKKAVASKKAIPEVVIVSRPRSTAKVPVKAVANEASDGEDDKSRDDDREHHPLIPTLLNNAPARLPDVSVNNPGEPETPPNFVPDSEGEDVVEPNVVGPRNSLPTPRSGTKKRRNDVTGDEEGKAGAQEEEERSSPKKKARTRFRTQAKVKNSTQPEENRGGQARQKGKRVVSSDEDEDDFIGDAMLKKTKKKATAVLSSDQDEAAEDDSIKVRQFSAVGRGSVSGFYHCRRICVQGVVAASEARLQVVPSRNCRLQNLHPPQTIATIIRVPSQSLLVSLLVIPSLRKRNQRP
jgi:hypothetical protein